MAAPTINVNLTLIDDADDDNASWIPVGRSGQVTGDPDVYIQRDDASTTTFSQVTTLVVETELLAFDTGGAITFGEHEHLYAWLNFTAPAKLESTANGGQRIAFGDGSSGTAALANYAQYYVGGNESEFVSGGWRCYCASPTVTPQEGVVESTPISFAAGGRGAESVGKDNMFVDVMRYGRGLQLVDGDSTNPGTMKSFTDENDLITNQYGVIRAQGSGASVQGEVSIGHTDATSTDTFFNDSNYAFFVPNKNPLSGISTYATLSTFTGIRVLGSATTCLISNFAFSTADEYDKGFFSASTTYPFTYSAASSPLLVELDGCTFNDWGQTHFSSTTEMTNTTWIGCEVIVPNGGSIDQCTIETGIGGTYLCCTGTSDTIQNVSFIGPESQTDGRAGLAATASEGLETYGHGLEVTAGGTYNFVGNTFSLFDANGTDGAAVHINGGATGIAVTFNITGGGTGGPDQGFTYKLTPAGVSTVTFVSAVTVNINGLPVVPTGNATEIRILGAGTTTEIAGVGTENHRTSTYSFSLSAGTNFDVRILNLDYVPLFISDQTASTDPTNIPVDLKIDRVYDDDTPPSGE